MTYQPKVIFVSTTSLQEGDDHGLEYEFICLTCGGSIKKEIWNYEEGKKLHQMLSLGEIEEGYLNHNCKPSEGD